MKLTYNDIKTAAQKKQHSFWEGTYNPFLYGIRSRSLNVDEWNDWLGMCFEDESGNKHNLIHKGSTKPGLYWLRNKMGNMNGTAILQLGQFRSCWTIGDHKGYIALVQAKPEVFRVWRDNDQDGQFDYSGPTYRDVQGLNMHTESLINDVEKVGPYSAGCQVRAFDKEHFAIMSLLERSVAFNGKNFSYTLFDEHDFIP